MKDLIIEQNDAAQTLIKYLNKYLNKAPNSLLNKWIRTKKIKVNRKRAESSQILNLGDTINFFIYDEVIDQYREKKIRKSSSLNLDIAFEDKDIIVIDKPQNVLSHAANPSDYGLNVVDFIVDYLIEKKEYIPRFENTFKPSIINRLDRNTMGLVLGVKNRQIHQRLSRKESLQKYYLAIVEGKFDKELVIKNSLVKDEKNFVKVSKEGKKSTTIVKPLKASSKYSLVEIELKTGRTHQIRASLADIGHAIIGDRRYSKSKLSSKYKDQQLVAYKLVINNENYNKTIYSKFEKQIKNLYEKLVMEE